MRAPTRNPRRRLPRRFDELSRLMPPRAIADDAECKNTIEMIDRLMATSRLTHDQARYLETLVQLVQAYEAAHHPINVASLGAVDSLKYLLAENDMTASDLGSLLGVHASMGSKILNHERSLTVDHIRKLATRFNVSPQMFFDLN